MRTALGWRSHSGWAVLVVVREPVALPDVLDRKRVELLDGSLPRQPYHAIVEEGIALDAARDLIARVEEMAIDAAVAATTEARDAHGVEAVGVVGRRRNVPDELERILGSHSLLHAAEGDLYDRAVVEAAARAGLPVTLVDPDGLAVPIALDAAGKSLGPPWQKDHKLAGAAALIAL